MGSPSIVQAPSALPPPPPNPPTVASPAVQMAGQQTRKAAQSAAAGGFSGTLLTGAMGAPAAPTAKQTLGAG